MCKCDFTIAHQQRTQGQDVSLVLCRIDQPRIISIACMRVRNGHHDLYSIVGSLLDIVLIGLTTGKKCLPHNLFRASAATAQGRPEPGTQQCDDQQDEHSRCAPDAKPALERNCLPF